VNGLGDEEIRRLLSSPVDGRPGLLSGEPRLKNLTSLSIPGARIVDDTLAFVATRLPNLESLDVSNCALISDDGVKQFVRSGLVSLRLLSFCADATALTDESVDALLECVNLEHFSCRRVPGITKLKYKMFVERVAARRGFPRDGEVISLPVSKS
jgi:hypothetical protein